MSISPEREISRIREIRTTQRRDDPVHGQVVQPANAEVGIAQQGVGKSVTTASMPALKILDTATPASTRVMRLAPVRSAMNSTSSTPRTAPRKAARGVRATDWGNRAEHSATISPSPRVDPDDVGGGQGVMEDALDDRSGHRQGRPRQQAAAGAGQADILDDLSLHRALQLAQQGLGHQGG